MKEKKGGKRVAIEEGSAVEDEPRRITPEELDRMIREITIEVPRAQPRVPVNAETTKYWIILTKQIAEIKAKGWMVEIPFDI